MAHVKYPETFPTECIGELISIVRGGMDQIVARKAEVGLHAWNLQGYGQSVLLGSPDGPFMALVPEQEAQLQDQLNEFADAFAQACPDRVSAAQLSEVKSVNVTSGAGAAPQARIDWAKWIRFVVEVVLPIILKS